MRYFLQLSYDGFNYSGWQRQKNTTNTIQEILECQLQEVFKQKITLIGCGRTDAGVHASQYFAHFDLGFDVSDQFTAIINHRLPAEITIQRAILVEDLQHARYDATLRQYEYYISLVRDPFLARYIAYYGDEALDFSLLSEAIKQVNSYTDFSNMCKQPDKNNHNNCHIYENRTIISANGKMLKITLSADRFLRGMVRIIVAKAIECATSKISFDEYQSYLANKKPRKFKNMAHPQGLYLSKVEYPFLKVKNESVLKSMLDLNFQSSVEPS